MATVKRYRVLRHHLGDRQVGDTTKQHMFEPGDDRDLDATQAAYLVQRGVLEEAEEGTAPAAKAKAKAKVVGKPRKPAAGNPAAGKGAAPANKSEGGAPDNKGEGGEGAASGDDADGKKPGDADVTEADKA